MTRKYKFTNKSHCSEKKKLSGKAQPFHFSNGDHTFKPASSAQRVLSQLRLQVPQ